MNSKELLSRITVEQILQLIMSRYKASVLDDVDPEAFHIETICHNGDSHKLYLYKDSKTFYCYSNCGAMSLYDLIMQMEDISFAESVTFIQNYFNIGNSMKGQWGRPKLPEAKIIPKKEIDYNEKLPEYDFNLNIFQDYKAIEWLVEGIIPTTMDKYNIKFDMYSNAIIIPHYDIDGNLVGIRQRCLDKRDIELGRKYIPYSDRFTKVTYRHALSKNLYGIHINSQSIKQTKKCIIWESEKSVLKMDSIYSENPSVAIGGSSLSEYQLHMLKTLEAQDIYLFFDYEEDNEYWTKKLNKLYRKIIDNGFNCYILDDELKKKHLRLKDSAVDHGKEVFEILLRSAKKVEL